MNLTANLSASEFTGQGLISLSRESLTRALLYVVASFCLCIMTSILLLLLILVILRQKSLLSGAKLLILHQLVTESQLAMIHWPVYIIEFILSQNDYHFSATFCKHYNLSYMTTTTAGLWGLCLLALNRFLAVAVPHKYQTWSRLPINMALIVAVWLIGFFDHLYFYLGGDGGFCPTSPFGICSFLKPGTSFKIANAVSTYIPLALAGLLYALLFVKATAFNRHRQIWNAPGTLSKEVIQSFHRRIRLAKLLFGMTLVHTVCFASIPFLQSFFAQAYGRDPMTRLWVRQFFCTGYLSAPIFFFALNKDCREGAKRLFGKPQVSVNSVKSTGRT